MAKEKKIYLMSNNDWGKNEEVFGSAIITTDKVHVARCIEKGGFAMELPWSQLFIKEQKVKVELLTKDEVEEADEDKE